MLENINQCNKPKFGSITGFGMNSTNNSNTTNPAMGAQFDQQMITDAATDNFIGNKINEFGEVDPMVQMGVSIPVVVAMNAAMDKYLKLYGGKYETSLPGRIGAFGDKVSNFVSESRVGKFFKNNIIDKVKPAAKKYVYDKSGVVRTLNQTLSRPDLDFVAKQMNPGLEHSLSQVTSAWDDFIKPLKSAKDLDCLGADKTFIEQTENLIKNAAPAERSKILLQQEYKLLRPNASAQELKNLLNYSEEQLLKRVEFLKVRRLGFKDLKEFNLIKGDPANSINKVIECLEKTDKKFFTRMKWSDANLWTKVKGNLLGRKLTFDQLRNITISSLAKEGIGGAKTKFGRGLAKWVNLITDGATNRMFAGKFAALMQAYFLAEALIMANKQETTGDKLKSFAERLTELIGFFVFMGPSIKLMHKIGNFKFSGMTPQQVEAYKNAVLEFNEKVMNCSFANKGEYKAARKALKDMYRPKTKNPITWLARKVGDFVGIGGDKTTIRGYSWAKIKQKNVDLNIANIMKNPVQYLKNIPARLKDVVCNPKYWTKKFMGWPVRFLLPMMVIMPFLNKIAVKGTHAIVGKPKYSILDQEKIEKEQEKAQEAMQEQQAAQNGQQVQQDSVNNSPSAQTPNIPEIRKPKDPNSYDSDTNLIKMTANGQKIDIKDNKPEEDNRYIPNPQGMVPQNTVDTSEADNAIAQADKIEKEIEGILKMN